MIPPKYKPNQTRPTNSPTNRLAFNKIPITHKKHISQQPVSNNQYTYHTLPHNIQFPHPPPSNHSYPTSQNSSPPTPATQENRPAKSYAQTRAVLGTLTLP